MLKCDICGTEQIQINKADIQCTDNMPIITEHTVVYNITFTGSMGGKKICNKCMSIYNAVDAARNEFPRRKSSTI